MILLDIDGVMNPLGLLNPQKSGLEPLRHHWGTWYINPAWKSLLASLSKLDKPIWVSTWEDESNVILQHYGLPTWDYISLEPPLPLMKTETIKLPAVEAWTARNLHPNEPVIWIDDELEQDAFDWAENRKNTMLVKTDPEVGLTKQQWITIVDYVRKLPTPSE